MHFKMLVTWKCRRASRKKWTSPRVRSSSLRGKGTSTASPKGRLSPFTPEDKVWIASKVEDMAACILCGLLCVDTSVASTCKVPEERGH